MKSFLAVVFATLVTTSCFAQTSLNLANGIPPQGSYGGSNVDTVNLLNGNLTLHIPLPVDVPQRGKLGVKYYLVVNAKSWRAAFDPTYQANQWSPSSVCSIGLNPTSGPCGQGPVFVSTASLGMTRGFVSTSTDGSPTDYVVTDPTSVDTWDGSGHGLVTTGTTGVYVANDTSGYRVQVSGSSGLGGTPYDVLITDRNGTQYKGTFHHDLNTCKTDRGNGLPGSTTTTDCTEHFELSSITDANGNVLSAPLGIPILDVPQWNGPTLSAHEAIGTEVDGCLTSFGTPWVYFLTYPAPNGQSNQIKLCFAVYPQLSTSFSPAGIHQFQDVYGSRPFPGSYRQPIYLSDVILPDGTKWSIGYDVYGEIINLATPTGGNIQYSWTEGQFPTMSGELTSVSRAVHTRKVTDANGNSFNWSYQWGTQDSNGNVSHTVTDPNNNDTVHVFAPIIATTEPMNLKEQHTYVYQGTGGSRTELQQVDTTWQIHLDGGMGVPTDKQTKLFPSGKVSLEHTDYDPSSPTLGLPVSQKVYDWDVNSPGALLRETDTVYQWQIDSRYAAANLLDLPASSIVISPVGPNPKSGCPVSPGVTANCMAETDYTYDEAAYLTSYESTAGALPTGSHVAAPNPAPVRGNLTTVSKWLSTGGSVISHTNWYDTGEPHIQSDPLGHNTTISYDPVYNGALPTKTCNAKNQCVSATYDLNTGLIASFTDENASYQASGTTQGDPAHTTTYGYDSMRRIKSAVSPPDSSGQQAQTTFSYPDATTIVKLQSITSALTDTLTTHMDGLGHVSQTEHLTPDGTVIVHTDYDGLGHATSVTNPYITTTDPTYGTVQTAYDALGRPATITEQDSSVKRADYSAGNCVTSTDEAGKPRKTCSDGLGRLVEVDEPNPGSVNVAAQGTLAFSGSLGVRNGVNSRSATQAAGTITITGTAPSPVTVCNPDITPTINNPCPGARTYSDHGTVTLTVGGHSNSVNYSASEGSGSVALDLQTAINGDAGALIHVNSVSGGSLTVQSVAAGAGTNYSWSISSQSLDTTGNFGPGPGPFSGSPGTLSGGANAAPGITVYDKGTLTLQVGSFSGQVCYGASSDCSAPPPSCPTGNSTAVQVACIAASVLNSASSPVSATYSGTASLTIKDKTAGQVGNGLAVTVTAASTQTLTTFSPPSFSSGGATLGSGMNAGDVNNQPFVTLYSYDVLGNLLCVEQHGNVTGTGCDAAPSSDATSPWRVRRFTYDSLSRLLTAHNPESGTITYSYDADGNLLQKTSPAPNQTGTATQTISYCYDELNRVTGKAYSAQICPLASPVTYIYDSGPNAKGKLTGITDQAGTGSYSYDVLSRLASETRVINGISKSLSYDYNLDGSLKALHYPSGAVVTYAPDSAGRVLSAVDTADGINYVTSATYQPDGQMTGFVSGNGGAFAGITSSFSYNKRLQPVNMSASSPSQTVFSIGYDFHVGNGTSGSDNGNVWNIYNFRDRTRDQSFNYDALNRLTSASNAGTNCAATTVNGKTEYWGNSYGYDAWGNLTDKTITKCGAERFQPGPASVNNQLAGYGYDAAGNMTIDPTDSVTSSYDAENRIATANTAQGVFTYTYDADGNRVKKSSGSTGTLYWYMTPGIIGESDLSGVMKSEYVFFNGERVARRDLVSPGGVFYYFSDHLKTASVVTDSAGSIKAESDYYPWGGELQFVNSDSNHYKFTGKERDTGSGLDYFGARYYSNGLGRFITPDWAAKATAVPYAEFADPQSLNLYSYVRNVPTVNADTDGHTGPQGQCDMGPCDRIDKGSSSIGSWLGSWFQASTKTGDPRDNSNPNPEINTNNIVAQGGPSVVRGLDFLAEGASLLDPSGIIAAGQAFANQHHAEGVVYLGLMLIPGGDKAEEVVHVYRIMEGSKVVYVGITNDLLRRELEHGTKLVPVVQMGSRLEARAVEQALIQHHGLERSGGSLINKINSISPRNPSFLDYVSFGLSVLQSIGYL